MIRRAVAMSVLLGLVFSVLMIGVGSPAGAKAAEEPPKRLQTPLLSARRFPTALEGSADPDLASSLTTYLDKVVGTTCAIVELDGRVIYQRNEGASLAPASTLKLATALAAYEILGRDTTLTTRLVSTSGVKNGVLDGNLWVVGSGDPLLSTKGYTAVFDDPDQTTVDLGALADQLSRLGIKRITGDIIGDDSRYDQVRWIPTWPQRYQVGGTVAPLSALVVNDGSTGYAETPDATTTSRKAGDPPLLFAQTLRSILVQRGVQVGGSSSTGRAPADGREIGTFESLPVSKLVAEMLTDSDNTTAELLTKEIGVVTAGQGTTAAGLAGIRASLQRQGFDISSLVMNDGSGLDTGDRMTCSLLLELVEHVSENAELSAALPVAGKTGTLRRRMLAVPSTGKVRAKTGTLNGINALAGFVDTTQGSTLSFAFMHSGTDVRTTAVADGFSDRLVPYASKLPKISVLSPAPAK